MFKRFRRHFRAKARKERREIEQRREREAEWARQDIEYQNRLAENMSREEVMSLESCLRTAGIVVDEKQIIYLCDCLIGERWTPPKPFDYSKELQEAKRLGLVDSGFPYITQKEG